EDVAGVLEIEPLQMCVVQIDDAAPHETLGEIAAQRQRNPRIHLHVRREPGPSEITDRLGRKHGRVVDEYVQCAGFPARTLDEGLILLRLAEVRPNRPRLHTLALELGGKLLRLPLRAVEMEGDVDALLRQSERRLAADALAGTSNQSRSAMQRLEHACIPGEKSRSRTRTHHNRTGSATCRHEELKA